MKFSFVCLIILHLKFPFALHLLKSQTKMLFCICQCAVNVLAFEPWCWLIVATMPLNVLVLLFYLNCYMTRPVVYVSRPFCGSGCDVCCVWKFASVNFWRNWVETGVQTLHKHWTFSTELLWLLSICTSLLLSVCECGGQFISLCLRQLKA